MIASGGISITVAVVDSLMCFVFVAINVTMNLNNKEMKIVTGEATAITGRREEEIELYQCHEMVRGSARAGCRE